MIAIGTRAELPASAGFFGPSVLHVPDYGGEQLVSWVLLEGWLAELDEQVGGRAVAFLPSTLMLLVCADEPRLVEQLYELAADEYARTPRPLSPMGYTTDDDGRVVPFLPPRRTPRRRPRSGTTRPRRSRRPRNRPAR